VDRKHNKGPIGPLDPDEPPPFDPGLRRQERLTVADATRALRSLGVRIRDRDIERSIREGTGPLHTVVGSKLVEWGEALDWASRTYPNDDELTRKEATEYLHGIGCPLSDVTLQQLGHRGPPFRFVGEGLNVWYKIEDLDKWWAERKATWPAQSFAPKFRPLNCRSRCPDSHRADDHCPNVRHPNCAKYPRALCNVIRLPVRPGSPRKDWLPRPFLQKVGGKLEVCRMIDGKLVIVDQPAKPPSSD
jgi:hypothetical protein